MLHACAIDRHPAFACLSVGEQHSLLCSESGLGPRHRPSRTPLPAAQRELIQPGEQGEGGMEEEDQNAG